MKLSFSLLLLTLLFVFISCNSKATDMKPVEEPSVILKSITSFLNYREQHVKLYEDFNGMDSASKFISKKAFLKLLSTGEYLPLRMISKDSTPCYKLYILDSSVQEEIRTTIKWWGLEEYDYYNVEGKELPNYKFEDMEGRIYTNQNTKGNILVVKCWFLDCPPCVREIPALNQLKREYSNRKDILFVSLCWDSKKDVEKFLKTTEFNYAIVPDQYKFLTEKLQLNAYPTHFVINKLGIITIKTHELRALTYALKKESLK